jgi:3-oxoadipate enol-lactonase
VGGGFNGAVNVLLLHSGITDRRMWRPQIEALEWAGHHVAAPDLRGYGGRPLGRERYSHARDVEPLLHGPTVVVGSSLGGRVAIQLTLLRPELVERLVLIAPGLPGWEWSADVRQGWEAEETAFAQGDLEAAAEACLRLWVDGPRRAPEQVNGDFRAAVRDMILRSYELQKDVTEDAEDDIPGGPVIERLQEIRCPTLVLVGEEDVPDMQAIAAHVVRSVPDARLATIPGAGHLPSLERPDDTDAILFPFLDESV